MAKHTLLEITLINEEDRQGIGVTLGLPYYVEEDSAGVANLKIQVDNIVRSIGSLIGATSLEKEEDAKSQKDEEFNEMLKTAKMLGELASMMKKVAPKHATEEQLKQLDEMEQFAEIAKMVENFTK